MEGDAPERGAQRRPGPLSTAMIERNRPEIRAPARAAFGVLSGGDDVGLIQNTKAPKHLKDLKYQKEIVWPTSWVEVTHQFLSSATHKTG